MSQLHTPAPQLKARTAAAVLAAVFLVGTIVTAIVLTTHDDNPDASAARTLPLAEPIAPLQDAPKTCDTGNLADNENTLLLDMAGKDYGTGTETIDDVLCVLSELEAPQSVIAQMESTRALDGMRSATWSSFEATWTYHPDDGLDLILTHQN